MIPIYHTDKILGELSENYGRYYGNYEFQTALLDGSGLFSPRRLQRKAWVFSGLITEEFITGFAIVDAGMVATAFCYVKDRITGNYFEEKTIKPLGFSDNFSPSLQVPWGIQDGKKSWRFGKKGDSYKFEYLGDEFSLQYTSAENPYGISTIAPSRERPFHFTYKNMNLLTHAVLSLKSKEIAISGEIGVLDFSKGYPPRETFWNWASFIGSTDQGDSFALNLVGVFNDGLENIYWLKGEPHPLGKAIFIYDKPISLNKTSIYTDCKIIDLIFIPEGKRSEDLNVLFYKSQFIQAFGKFSGKILHEGKYINVSGSGLVEEHLALW